jgi:hypothetical protein
MMARSSMSSTSDDALRGSPRKSQIPFATSSGDEKTDYSRWRLLDDRGRQTWHYLETDERVKKWPQSVADKYHLGMPTVSMHPSEHGPLTEARAYPTSNQRKRPCKPPKMASLSLNNCNCLQATGLANTVVRYSSSPVSSLLGTSPRLRSHGHTVLKSRATSLQGRMRTVGGVCTLKVRAPSSGPL